MIAFVVLLQFASTFAMVGLIWFVQVVHYPLFSKVGADHFRAYELAHQRLTTIVVAPLMLTEAATAVILIWLRPDAIPAWAVLLGIVLVGLLWASTAFWQVPAHERLAKAFDPATHRRLVRSNWLRTIVWTVRGVLVGWMVLQVMPETGLSAFSVRL